MLRLVAFDMDGTLLHVASSWRAVHDHFGDTNDEGLRRFLANEIDDREFIRSDVRVWWRHDPALTLADLRRILEPVPLMPGAHGLFERLRARRVTTAIVSGGLDLVAERIGGELGVDHVLANGLEADRDGRLTGDGIIRVPIHGKEGVLAALQDRLGIAPGETASVGNSEIDVGLFRRSRMGIAFLPEDDAVRSNATAIVTERDLGRVADLLERFPTGALGGRSA